MDEVICLLHLSNYHEDKNIYHSLYSFRVNVYVYTYIKGGPTAERKVANGTWYIQELFSTAHTWSQKKSCFKEKVLNIAKGSTDPRIEFISQDYSSQSTNLEHITISEY